MNLQDLSVIYEETLNKIDEAENARILSVEDAEFARQEALADYQDLVAEFSGYESDDYAEFEDELVGNSLGAYILGAGNALDYADYEDYVMDLAEFSGADPMVIDEIITGDYEPDEDEAYAILSDLGLIEDDYYDDYDELEYAMDDEDMVDFYDDSDYYEDDNADFTQARVEELEDTVAEFQTKQAINDELTKRYVTAMEMVENGDLPVVTFSRLFPESDDMVADFAASCLVDEWTPADKLKSIDYVLACFAEVGLSELGIFGADVDEVIEFAAEDEMENNMAYEDFKLFQSRQ